MQAGPIALALVCTMTLSGCLGADADADPAATDSAALADTTDTDADLPRGPALWYVDIDSAVFVDGTITIQVGDTVQWTMRDLFGHTVTSKEGVFDSGPMAEAPVLGTFAFTFEDEGSYPYRCRVHGSMEATITVREQAEGPL